VARYGWAANYHRLIDGPLASVWPLAGASSGRGCAGVFCVDSAPLLEQRPGPRQAGLGWIGKNGT